MRILFCGKWPPIQGGACRESYEFVVACLQQEHSVTVITNASCVEPGFQVALKGNELSDRFTSFGDGDVFRVPHLVLVAIVISI
jgi:hypothetical protein